MKKRIVSMLLALALVVSGMPVGITAEGVNAVEISKREVFAETEETESAVENNDTYKEELRPETSGLYAFNVSDGKAVGSDGVAYDDVVYLSADTVKSFGAEGQSVYVEICDQIAEDKNAGDYLEDVVIAVDEDGKLLVQREVPMKAVQAVMEELAEDAFEASTVVSEDKAEDDDVWAAEEVKELSAKEDTEENAADDNSDEEGLHNEDSDEENGSDEIDAEEAVEEASKVEASVEDNLVEKDEPSTEDAMTNDAMTNDNITDDVKTDDASVEDEEPSTEEAMANDAMADDAAAEEKTEAVAEELVLTAENMELIDELEAEEFEIIEPAKADIIIDLGYGSAGDIQQFNSILPAGDWFSKQLKGGQKSIYNASKVMGKGKNEFTMSPSSPPSTKDICQAISAYIMTEPYKCDWMDLTKSLEILDTYLIGGGSKKYKSTTITIPKSQYYTETIQKEANAKVLDLAAKAQQYAIKEYPAFPVFGIVEYYDKWICENNVYDDRGVLTKAEEDKYKDKNGNINLPADRQEPYYYCHSSYGVLLKGYGVCESYALAMTRLLDAIGIPNMYATGIGNGGGHAWNYIEMPDGKWYLQDSTWNDTTSTNAFLLCGDDANQPSGHKPQGTRWGGLDPFTFVERSSTLYNPDPTVGEVMFSKHLLHLEPKQKETLVCNNAYTEDKNVSKVWLSSNEKVAKVDQKGNVTAAAPGVAVITYTVAGISDYCVVYVSQINSLTFDDSGKASLTTSGSIVEGKGEEQHVYLSVNQKDPVFWAEDLEIQDPDHTGENATILNAAEIFPAVDIKSADPSVATVTYTFTENNKDKIDLKITPLKAGKTKIVITFGKKKATLNYSVGEKLDEKWFDLTEIKKLKEDENGNAIKLMYTGKAYKPKVTLSDAGKSEKVKFKVSYVNNKDAGTGSVIITGNGKHGGELRYDFEIKPLVLNVDTSSIKVSDKSVYNGGVNLTKSTVKHTNEAGKKVGLKAGKDYDIVYTKKAAGEQSTPQSTTQPTDVGEYTMEIVGKGNYAGTVKVDDKDVIPTTPIDGKTYTIEQIDLKKVKMTVKVNGTVPTVTVAIGKNVLFEKTDKIDGDYELTYYTDKECEDKINGTVFMTKTQYFVKIVPKGSNIKPDEKGIIKSFKTK